MVAAAILAGLLAEPKAPAFALSEIDLTPPEPLPLGGYTDRAGAVGAQGRERLMGRFAAFSTARGRFVMGCVEMLTLPEGLRDEVQKRIPPGTGLWLAATHTHSAPDSQMLNPRMNFRIPGIAPYSSRWLDWYSGRIAQGINAALAKPPEVIRSMEAIQWEADANRGRRSKAVPRRTVTVLTANGRPILGVYAAHPTLHDSKELDVSGDWPGAWMRSRKGPWIAATGAIGDVSPKADGETGGDKSRGLVENLVDNGDKPRRFPVNDLQNLGLLSVAIQVGKAEPHPNFPKDQKIDPGLARIVVSRFAPDAATMTMLRFGGFVIIGIPGEPTSLVERRLFTTFHMAGGELACFVSHVNGWAGYMLDPDDYKAGGYEAGLHFYGPGLAARLSEALDRGMKQLSRQAAASGKAPRRKELKWQR